jgi:hypothetical protein
VVLDVLHGKKSTAREIVLPVTLQVGEST